MTQADPTASSPFHCRLISVSASTGNPRTVTMEDRLGPAPQAACSRRIGLRRQVERISQQSNKIFLLVFSASRSGSRINTYGPARGTRNNIVAQPGAFILIYFRRLTPHKTINHILNAMQTATKSGHVKFHPSGNRPYTGPCTF